LDKQPIVTKRIYESPSKNDGYRVLVDRLWPRGVSKKDVQLDKWAKEIAPSDELRKWFDHDPEKFHEFKICYKQELEDHSDKLSELINRSSEQKVTLLYGAKDQEHNQAVVLKDVLKNKRET